MKETLKYIKVLSLGYGGFATMTLSTDFAKSLQQVQERLGLLDSLNYDALLDEAINGNGKEYLQKYQSTDDTIEYSLHFLRDRKDFLEMLQPDYLIEIDNSHKPPKPIWQRNPKRMFRWAFDAIDIYKADDVWTEEQWRECKWTLSEIEKGLGDRLRQFATAYDYSLDGDDPNQQATTEPQQITQEFETDEAKELFRKALVKRLIVIDGNKYKWADSASLYGYFVDKTSDNLNLRHSNNRIPWKLYGTIITNHSKMLATAKQAVNDYKNKQLPPPEGDDIVNDICK